MVCLHIYKSIVSAFSWLVFLKSVVPATTGVHYLGRMLRVTYQLLRNHNRS